MRQLVLVAVMILGFGGPAGAASETPPPSPTSPSLVDYWARRRAVVFRVEWGNPDSLPDVQLLRSDAPQQAVDSLRALAARLRWPDDIAPELHRRWSEDALYATDRTESAASPAPAPLPAAVAQALDQGLPAAWVQAHVQVDARFGLDEFVRYETRLIHRYRVSGLLHGAPEQAKSDFGMLAPSPDGRWVLDPFYGTEVYPDGKLGHDVDTGFQIYDARSGDLVYHDVGPAINLCFWLDARTFVLLGHERVYPAPKGFGFVTAIWVGDVEAGRIIAYLGAPLPPLSRRALWQGALLQVFQAAYPRLRFTD